MREEGLGLLDSVRETIRIAEEGHLPAQITHHKAMGASMWGKSVESLALVDAGNARGLDISSDAITISFTPFAFAPGVLNTTMPRSVHLSNGMLFTQQG